MIGKLLQNWRYQVQRIIVEKTIRELQPQYLFSLHDQTPSESK